MKWTAELIFIRHFRKTRFDAEAKGNSEVHGPLSQEVLLNGLTHSVFSISSVIRLQDRFSTLCPSLFLKAINNNDEDQQLI